MARLSSFLLLLAVALVAVASSVLVAPVAGADSSSTADAPIVVDSSSAVVPVVVESSSAAAPIIIESSSATPVVVDSSSAPVVVESSSSAAVVVDSSSSAAPAPVVESSSAAPIVIESSSAAPIVIESSSTSPVIVDSSSAAPIVDTSSTGESPVIVSSSSGEAPVVVDSSSAAPIIDVSSSAAAPVVIESSSSAAVITESSSADTVAPVVEVSSSSTGGGGVAPSANSSSSASPVIVASSSSASPVVVASSSSSSSTGGASPVVPTYTASFVGGATLCVLSSSGSNCSALSLFLGANCYNLQPSGASVLLDIAGLSPVAPVAGAHWNFTETQFEASDCRAGGNTTGQNRTMVVAAQNVGGPTVPSQWFNTTFPSLTLFDLATGGPLGPSGQNITLGWSASWRLDEVLPPASSSTGQAPPVVQYAVDFSGNAEACLVPAMGAPTCVAPLLMYGMRVCTGDLFNTGVSVSWDLGELGALQPNSTWSYTESRYDSSTDCTGPATILEYESAVAGPMAAGEWSNVTFAATTLRNLTNGQPLGPQGANITLAWRVALRLEVVPFVPGVASSSTGSTGGGDDDDDGGHKLSKVAVAFIVIAVLVVVFGAAAYFYSASKKRERQTFAKDLLAGSGHGTYGKF